MYTPRKTLPLTSVSDPDGVKLYTISASGAEVDFARYRERLAYVKKDRNINSSIPSFAIMHDGATCAYLIVGWWSNGNELFLSVSVQEQNTWIEDMTKYSFCIWDLEVIWHERNSFIRYLYSGNPDLNKYRKDMNGA